MTKLGRTLVALTLLASAAGSLHAQAAASSAAPNTTRFGVQLGYFFDPELAGIGVRLEHSLGSLLGNPQIHGLAEINWFPEDVDIFDFGYNVIYRFRANRVRPYAGGGATLLVASGGGASDSDLNLNAMGGVEFKPLGRITPFVQLRYLFAGDGDGLMITGGFYF